MILRSLLRFFTTAPQAPRRIESTDGRSVVLYAHVDASAKAKQPSSRSNAPRQSQTSPCVSGDHRAWLLSMRLDHLRICSASRSQRLSQLGIITAGDLLAADVVEVGRILDDRTLPRRLKRTVRAIQFSAAVPGMMPRDAMLLICVHRRSIRSLASESPAVLHRDLQRFALSTKGQRALKGRRLPSVKRIRRWVDACVDATRRPHVSWQ